MRFIEAVNDIPRKGYIRTLFYVTDNDDCSRFNDIKSGELCELKIDVMSPILRSISNYKLKFVKLQEVYKHESLCELIEYLDANDYDYSIRRSCDGIELETRKFEEGIRINQEVVDDAVIVGSVIENGEVIAEDFIRVYGDYARDGDVIIDEDTLDVKAIVDDDIRAMSSTKSALSRYDEIVNFTKHIDEDCELHDYEEDDNYNIYRDESNVSRRYNELARYL